MGWRHRRRAGPSPRDAARPSLHARRGAAFGAGARGAGRLPATWPVLKFAVAYFESSTMVAGMPDARSPDPTPQAPPIQPPPPDPLTRYTLAILYGLAQWVGEAVIGVIPLFMYEMAFKYSQRPITATCPPQSINANNLYYNCTKLLDNPSQEICILAVVISGLALLSTSPITSKKPRTITVFTRLLIVPALISLIAGSVFYAFFIARLDLNADAITYYILFVALISSFCLAVEDAVLSA
jgi:hypothetical protein